MVFYGYSRDTPGWRDDRKDELADRLSEMLGKLGYLTVQMRDTYPLELMKGGPYVEVDGGFGPGVRIRRITHLTPEQDAALVKDADRIFREVMGLVVRCGKGCSCGCGLGCSMDKGHDGTCDPYWVWRP